MGHFFLFMLSCFMMTVSAWAGDPVEGKKLFDQKCMACHTLGGGKRVGPDLKGVTESRDSAWLKRWIREPDKMLAEKDPIATKLLADYAQVPMPNLGVTEAEVDHILVYMAGGSSGTEGVPTAATVDAGPAIGSTGEMGSTQRLAFSVFLLITLVIMFVFFWVSRTTRNPQPVDIKAAYKLRKVFFIGGSLTVIGILAATLSKSPYADPLTIPDQVVYVTAQQFSFAFTREPVASVEDLGSVTQVSSLDLPAGALVEFRVTSLDATHGFAIYNGQGTLKAQTQAMPGYTNRLRVRFEEPGTYEVLCLEYCGVAHHLMKTSFNVQ